MFQASVFYLHDGRKEETYLGHHVLEHNCFSQMVRLFCQLDGLIALRPSSCDLGLIPQ